MTGALAAIEQGFIQREIQEAAYRYQQALEANQAIVVGLNAFQVEERVELERLKVDPAIEADQCRHLADLRGRRDTARVAEKLDCLEDAARGHENLVPIFIAAVESDVIPG